MKNVGKYYFNYNPILIFKMDICIYSIYNKSE